MKRFMNIELKVMISVFFIASAVFANDKEMKDSPCEPVFKACHDAGFQKGTDAAPAPAGKDIWDNCKEPLLKGPAVAGVTIDQKKLDHCKKFKEDKKQWMKKWKSNN